MGDYLSDGPDVITSGPASNSYNLTTAQQTFDKLLPRISKLDQTSGMTFLDALNTGIEFVFLRLWHRKSDLIRASLNMDTGTVAFFLPTSFRGFFNHPFLVDENGNTITLFPAVSDTEQLVAIETGVPKYYLLTGMAIQLFPQPLVSYRIRGHYFSCPSVIDMDGYLPWSDIFKGVIEDATIESIKFGGITALMANQAFLATADGAIEQILNRNSAPRRVKAHWF